MDRVAGQYAIYGLNDVILNTEGRMQMRYNILLYVFWAGGLYVQNKRVEYIVYRSLNSPTCVGVAYMQRLEGLEHCVFERHLIIPSKKYFGLIYLFRRYTFLNEIQ